MTILSKILNFIAELIGTTSMGTTADTITGAIAEVNAKTTTVQTASWADISPQVSTTNTLATFNVEPGKYFVTAQCSNGLSDVVRVSIAIRASSGTTTVSVNGDGNGYSGRNNWATCSAYYEFSTSGSIRITSYSRVGTDPVLSGNAICMKLI